MEVPWYAIYTFPNAERKVAQEMTEMNITNYLPTCEVIRQRSDRKKKLTVPLFPNYIFLQLGRREHYRVLSIAGVSRFIQFGDKPASIMEKEIKDLQIIMNSKEEVTTERFFNPGERVRLTGGPMKGLEGMVLEKSGNKRFYLRLTSIEQAVSIAVDPQYMERIN